MASPQISEKSVVYAGQLRFWMKLVAYYYLATGALATLSICYAFPWGIISLLLGYLTYQAADHIDEYVTTGDPWAFEQFLSELRNKYVIHGLVSIMTLLFMLMYIGFIILYIFVVFFFVFFAAVAGA